MGFLHDSVPLTWEESLPYLQYVREHGIEQFLSCYHAVKRRQNDHLRWGDEIEYGVFKLSGCSPTDPNRSVSVSLHSADLIEDLKRLEDHGIAHGLSEADKSAWMPEYGAWMLESTPGKPFEGLTAILRVEDSMRLRRSRLLAVLAPDEIAPTMTVFPMLGVTGPKSPSFNSISESDYLSDDHIFPHPRFRTLTQNIRSRRGSKVSIVRPVFRDLHTQPNDPSRSPIPETVHADAMGFGMGCCCLQVTFQAKDVEESRHLYDQIATLTPIMLALTAAAPFLRGWLTDDDARWDVISASVDDRTIAERNLEDAQLGDPRLAGSGTRPIPKSRYASFSAYLGDKAYSSLDTHPHFPYNDVPLPRDSELYERLLSSGIDQLLAAHVSHLFIRDPLVVFADRIHLDDGEAQDHWESLQSTNWQTVRWKPPPLVKGGLAATDEQHIGWRVEFRSMELQLTDFENAAFVVFVVLLSRVILGLELNLYLPVSLVDENMNRAIKRGACLEEKFHFRKQLFPRDVVESVSGTPVMTPNSKDQDEYAEMTIAEILLGFEGFPGLIPLCRTYLDFIGCDSVTRCKIDTYLDFIANKATGKLPTTAQWLREFVRGHPDYKGDSKIPETTAHDLCKLCRDVGEGRVDAEDLLGRRIGLVCPAKNPFRHLERVAGTASDDFAAALSCAKCACVERPGDDGLLQLYLKRAVQRKVQAQEEILNSKRDELQQLQEQIDALENTLHNLKDTLH